MFAFQPGEKPVVSYRVAISRLALVVAALSLSGCATTSQHQTAYTYPGEQRVAAPKPERVAEAVIEVEADGLPAQTPPDFRARQMADDPSEPWSKNYGGVNPSRAPIEVRDEETPNKKSKPPAIPQDLPPQFRRQLAAAIGADQDE